MIVFEQLENGEWIPVLCEPVTRQRPKTGVPGRVHLIGTPGKVRACE